MDPALARSVYPQADHMLDSMARFRRPLGTSARTAPLTHPDIASERRYHQLLFFALTLGLALSFASPLASSAWADQPPASVGTTGLPGINRVLTAQPLSGAGLFAGAGYGFSGEVMAMEDTHHRASGVLALGLGVTRWLALAVRFDGRLDTHNLGAAPDMDDYGWVGDPRIAVQVAFPLSDSLYIGGNAVVWFPGANAPSVIAGAISGDVQLALGYVGAGGRLRVGANVGVRIDNSAASIDNPETLSQADRLSLGVSDANALLVGVGVGYQVGKAEILGEVTYDRLFGDLSPDPDTSPLRVAAGLRLALSDSLRAQFLIEANASTQPDAGLGEPLAPFEPRVSVTTGLHYRFGGPKKQPSLTDGDGDDDDDGPVKPTSLAGRITTESGAGLADATVEVTVGPHKRTARTDGDGRFSVDLSDVDVDTAEIQNASVSVTAVGFKPADSTIDFTGDTSLSLDVELETDLPRGQLRGVVRAFNGKPVSGEITVQPLGKTITASDDGSFELDVPPGKYTVVIKAKGFKGQRRKVEVQDGGVTILHIDLRRGR